MPIAPDADEIQTALVELIHEQESPRKSETLYRDFFQNNKDAMYLHDLNGRYLMVNKAGENLLGYSREEILNMSVFDVVPVSQFSQIGESLKQKLTDHAQTTCEVEAIRKDGTHVPVEVSSRLVYENGVPVGVQGTARDLSERRNAEVAVRESEERFRNLFENARDTVFTCDLEGNFTSMNAAGEALTGFARAEALKSNFTRVVAPEYLQVAQDMLSRKAAGDIATAYGLELISKDGRRVFV